MTAWAGEGHQRTQLFHKRWPDSANFAERLDRAESADGIAIRRDPLCERRADAWQRLYFRRRCSVEIHRGSRPASVRRGRRGRRRRCGLRFVPRVTNRVHSLDLSFQRR